MSEHMCGQLEPRCGRKRARDMYAWACARGKGWWLQRGRGDYNASGAAAKHLAGRRQPADHAQPQSLRHALTVRTGFVALEHTRVLFACMAERPPPETSCCFPAVAYVDRCAGRLGNPALRASLPAWMQSCSVPLLCHNRARATRQSTRSMVVCSHRTRAVRTTRRCRAWPSWLGAVCVGAESAGGMRRNRRARLAPSRRRHRALVSRWTGGTRCDAKCAGLVSKSAGRGERAMPPAPRAHRLGRARPAGGGVREDCV
jgi:hypothetical protein